MLHSLLGVAPSGEFVESRFNPRTPGGVRLVLANGDIASEMFQFTHLGRGATIAPSALRRARASFQFTHPGRGATEDGAGKAPILSCFNSRIPGGVRLTRNELSFRAHQFQFTHPGRGATWPRQGAGGRPAGFNSRTPGGVRQNS